MRMTHQLIDWKKNYSRILIFLRTVIAQILSISNWLDILCAGRQQRILETETQTRLLITATRCRRWLSYILLTSSRKDTIAS